MLEERHELFDGGRGHDRVKSCVHDGAHLVGHTVRERLARKNVNTSSLKMYNNGLTSASATMSLQ